MYDPTDDRPRYLVHYSDGGSGMRLARRTVYDWLARGRSEPHGALEALAVLDAEYVGWEPPPIREVLLDVDDEIAVNSEATTR